MAHKLYEWIFKKFYDKEMFYVIKLCLSLSTPVNGKRMLYNEISLYMLFLNNVCSEALLQSKHPSFDLCSKPADQWVKYLFTLNINTAPPSTD